MAKRPTLKTIAAESGFAVPTVSRALSDAPDISASTKALIRDAARRLGYVPDRAGVRLRTGRTQVVTLILPTGPGMMDLTARLIGGIATGLGGTAYHLTVTPVLPGQDPSVPVRHVAETASADAVILNQVAQSDARVAYLMERGVPVVTHGRTGLAHGWADFDNAAFARLAVARLAERGCRAVLAVAPPEGQSYGAEMRAAARAEAAARGVDLLVLPDVTIDDPIEAIRAGVARALSLRPDLDGLLVPAPLAAMAAIAAFEAAGRTVGGGLEVVAKDAGEVLSLFRPGIGIVREDVAAAGSVLARAALHAIDARDAPPLTHLEVPRAVS